MKIGILSNEGWHFRDLQRAAGSRHEILRIDFAELGGTITDSHSEIYCNDFRLSQLQIVFVRAMPAGSLEQVVVRMDLLYRLERLGVEVVNPAKSIEAAVDKYLSLCRLHDAGISIPQSAVFQTPVPAIEFLQSCGNDVVFKPIFGSEGQGLERITNAEQANAFFDQLVENQKAIFLQQFIADAELDLRLFVIGNKVFAMARENAANWRKNVSLGGTARTHQPTDEEKEIAISSAAAIGTYIAGVDILKRKDGSYQVLEVNSSPGWRALARVTGVDIAEEIFHYLESGT